MGILRFHFPLSENYSFFTPSLFLKNKLMENIFLTEKQKKQLLDLLGRGFVLIRELGWAGKSIQAADLADTLHSLPYEIFPDNFSWDRVTENFDTYQKKYPPNTIGGYFDFLALLEKIRLDDSDE